MRLENRDFEDLRRFATFTECCRSCPQKLSDADILPTFFSSNEPRTRSVLAYLETGDPYLLMRAAP